MDGSAKDLTTETNIEMLKQLTETLAAIHGYDTQYIDRDDSFLGEYEDSIRAILRAIKVIASFPLENRSQEGN